MPAGRGRRPVTPTAARADAWIRLAWACWAAGVFGWMWAFLAQQPVGAALWMPGMPLAIDRFAQHAWITGFALRLMSPAGPVRRVLVGAAAAGCVLALGAMAVSAATGLRGGMWGDPRSGAGMVFAGRVVGNTLLVGALAMSWAGRREEPEDP